MEESKPDEDFDDIFQLSPKKSGSASNLKLITNSKGHDNQNDQFLSDQDDMLKPKKRRFEKSSSDDTNVEVTAKSSVVDSKNNKLRPASGNVDVVLNNSESKENSQNKNISITLNNYIVLDKKNDQDNKQEILSKIESALSNIDNSIKEKTPAADIQEEASKEETSKIDCGKNSFDQKNTQEEILSEEDGFFNIGSSIKDKTYHQEDAQDVLSKKDENFNLAKEKTKVPENKQSGLFKKNKDAIKADNLAKEKKSDKQKISKKSEKSSKVKSSAKEKISNQKNNQEVVLLNKEKKSHPGVSVKEQDQENKEDFFRNEEKVSKLNNSINDKNFQRNSTVSKHADILYLGLRHLEGGGIGYNKGYSTLEGQYYKAIVENDLLLFIDLRMHFFNNGQYAANTGVGSRWRSKASENVFGLNIYYDSRKVHTRSLFNQVSFGLEWLGDIDFCFNGSIPVCNKKTLISTSRTDYPGGYYVDDLKYDSAIVNFFLEIGKEIEKSEKFTIYGAIGQYYLELSKCDAIFGGKSRVKFCFWNICDVEFSASYDYFFRFRGQMLFGIHYSFGGSKNKKCYKSINKYPYHNDILPIGEKDKYYWNW